MSTENQVEKNTTIKLSDTQVFVLNAAADHAQGWVEAFPEKVKGGARAKVIETMTTKGWIKLVGKHHKITKAGFVAIGRQKVRASKEDENTPKAEAATKIRKPSKQDQMLELIQRPEGASLAELMTATGWQPHSVRGALSTLNKHLEGAIVLRKNDDNSKVYRMGEAASTAASDTVSD